MDTENLTPKGIRSPDRPACNESLYGLRYPCSTWQINAFPKHPMVRKYSFRVSQRMAINKINNSPISQHQSCCGMCSKDKNAKVKWEHKFLVLYLMSNYFKLHLQTQVLKNPYDLPLPKIPISFLQAIPVRVMLKFSLWEATTSLLLPTKVLWLTDNWPGWVPIRSVP
jgi:hypothetical protein